MAQLPWRTEFEIDEKRAAEAVLRRFPGLRPGWARHVADGWDHQAFLVNGEWIFRFPKRADSAERLAVERNVLPVLGPRLPLAVPEPEHVGEPGDDFPFLFLGHRLLPGVSGRDLKVPGEALGIAADLLAETLSRLHAFPVAEAAGLGVAEGDPAEHLRDAREEALRFLADVEALVPGRLVARCREFLDEVPPHWPGPPVLVHGDLVPEHLIFDPTTYQLRGVIDWSDLWLCDPACDFAGPAYWAGRALTRHMAARYRGEKDPAFEERVRYLSVVKGIVAVFHGARGTRREYFAEGLRSLGRNLD
jgi:aminoglycoside phosphotransferase (APT) family kinase protein